MAKEIMEGLIKTDKGIVKIVGYDGATFVPHISDDYVLSWTNDHGLENPEPVKLPISNGEIAIGEAEPMEPNILIWIDTGNVSVKYRDSETGTFAEIQSGGGTDDGSVKKHNESETAHNDIRLLLADLSERLNAIADSDDTTLDQLSEIVAYIKANKTLIESVTTSKVNVADIVDNLTTNVSDQPLSAKMGVELRRLISTVENSANNAMSQASSAQSMASSAMNHASSAEEIASSAMQRASSAEQMASAAQTEIEKLKENGVPGGGAGTSVEEIHIGADEPEDDDIKIWIDPDDDGDGLTAEDVENALGYTPANAETVEDLSKAIADLPTKQHVSEEIAKAQLEGSGVDTSNFVMQSDLKKVTDAVCDETIIGGENYNLFKISEVTFKSRLQNDSEEIVSSNPNICVSGWIPVEYGKCYTYSALYNGERVTSMATGSAIFDRIHVKLADGTVLLIQQNNLKKNPDGTGITNSWSTIRANIENMVAIRFQSSYAGGIDVSTEEKLRAYEPMLVEGDTAEEARNNALTLPYMDGDAEGIRKVKYSLKHDETKADKTDLESAVKEISANRRLVNERQRYDGNFIQNERFIRSLANLRDSDNAKEFEITITNNSGATIKNAAIAVGLHNTVGVTSANNNLPFQIYDDVFSNPTGFKFYAGDTELPYYIESESDCNYIVDKNIKTDQKTMAVFSDGKIAVYNGTAKRMQISNDGGVSWTNICDNITSIPYRVLLPDSQDNLFVASNDGKKLYKYTSADGYKNGTEVITIGADDVTKIGSILAEDGDGNLYLGTYQAEWHCVVRKSTDHGNTWTIVFDSTECQHVHNIYVNKKVVPNEIFLALDANEPHAYVSTNAGATWTRVDVPYKNREYAFRYAGENFYIGCGERNVLGGATLYKTTDYNDQNAYYPLFDNGQGIRDVTNVVANSDDVLIAGGCVGDPVMTEQLFLSEDRGETWKTVLMRPYHAKENIAGKGLRTFSKIDEQILSETSSGYAMRFVYGGGAKTIMTVVNVGDVPTSGKTITLKTGYVANVEQMDEVLTVYENIDGKVADIHICDGYVADAVSNKRVMTADTELSNVNTKLGQTSEYKILANHAYKLNGGVNLGILSRLNFTKGFTVSMLFRKEDGKNYLADDKYHVIFQTGDTKLVLHKRSICLMSGETNIFKVGTTSTSKLYVADEYLNSVNEDYIRLTAYFTDDDLPVASLYTGNNWIDEVACEAYPITVNFSANDFIVGDSADNPNIARIEIYNRVLTHGEIMSLTNGCNLVTDGSRFN